MVLVCHMISQDRVNKESCDFIGRSPSRKVIILPGLVSMGTMVSFIN